MILFFRTPSQTVIAVETESALTPQTERKLSWLFGEAELLQAELVEQPFIGPRRELITPWSTCAVEITRNMGVEGITRIEEYTPYTEATYFDFDPMLQRKYMQLDQTIFTIEGTPEPIKYIDDINAYNDSEGLAMSKDEIDYLESVSKKMDRKLT